MGGERRETCTTCGIVTTQQAPGRMHRHEVVGPEQFQVLWDRLPPTERYGLPLWDRVNLYDFEADMVYELRTKEGR